VKTPRGFAYAGINCGIKTARKDLALVYSEVPAAVAGCFTVNASRAAPVVDAAARVPAEGMRAIVANSGNANALAGHQGVRDVQAVCAAVAEAIAVAPDAVVSAATGVIGVRLPVSKLVAAAPRLAAARSGAIEHAAEAIWTTDNRVKLASRTLRVGDREAAFSAFAKGAGMIAPELATVLAFITTDLRVSARVLQAALSRAVTTTFEMLTVDGDMSTNDAIFAMANGLAANDPVREGTDDFEALVATLEALGADLVKQIAEDGDGATKMLEVRISGAPEVPMARELARAVAGSTLVKAAVFGADPNWGRVLAAVGARVGSRKWPIDPTHATVLVQGTCVYTDGAPTGADAPALRAKMRDPAVLVEIRLAEGDCCATAWGSDLSYDFIKINADYTSLTHAHADGTIARDDRLTNYSPAFKRALVVEALSYIARFSNTRAVVKYGGLALTKDSLKASFANDINLLRSAGLLPIVVHGGSPEITSTMESLGRVAEYVDGLLIAGREDAEFVEMVLTGKINTELVSLLNRSSHHAVGISGKDGGLLRARRLVGEGGRDFGSLGEVTHVNHELLEVLLEKKYVPVVSPMGMGEDGEGYNIDADAAAAEIAIALKAEKLIYLADVAGILENGELLSEMSASDVRAKIESGVIRGGMLPKARSVLRAIEGGVPKVHILDGRTPHSVIAELFTDRGVGTLVHKD
jgi:acetylglutamate kinase